MDTDIGTPNPEETTGALYEQSQWLQVTLSSIGDVLRQPVAMITHVHENVVVKSGNHRG